METRNCYNKISENIYEIYIKNHLKSIGDTSNASAEKTSECEGVEGVWSLCLQIKVRNRLNYFENGKTISRMLDTWLPYNQSLEKLEKWAEKD